jgi:hypothetical protein
MRQPRPEPPCSFEEWLNAQQFPAPRSPEEEDLHRKFIIGLRIAWNAGFQAGFVVAKERGGEHPLSHTPKEKNDA